MLRDMALRDGHWPAGYLSKTGTRCPACMTTPPVERCQLKQARKRRLKTSASEEWGDGFFLKIDLFLFRFLKGFYQRFPAFLIAPKASTERRKLLRKRVQKKSRKIAGLPQAQSFLPGHKLALNLARRISWNFLKIRLFWTQNRGFSSLSQVHLHGKNRENSSRQSAGQYTGWAGCS